MDLAEGMFFVQALPSNFNKTDVEALLAEIDPGEILAADILATHETLGGLFQGLGHRWTPQPQVRFSSSAGEARLKRQFDLATLDSAGGFKSRRIGGGRCPAGLCGFNAKGRAGPHQALAPGGQAAPWPLMPPPAAIWNWTKPWAEHAQAPSARHH